MARASGRNIPFSIFVNLVCAAVVVALFVVAVPIWPWIGDWLASLAPGIRGLISQGFVH